MLKEAFRASRTHRTIYVLISQIRDLVSLSADVRTPQSFNLLNDKIKNVISEIYYVPSEDFTARIHWPLVRYENVNFIKEILAYFISLFKSEDADYSA